MAVDTYFRINRTWDDKPQYDDMNAIDRAIDYDDFEIVYGFNNDELEEMSPRTRAYSLNHRYPEKMVVLFDCKHMGETHYHHPDYNKPFEIEILCVRCHYQRHYTQRHDSIDRSLKRPRSQAAMTANDSSTVAPSENSLTAVTSQDRATQQQYSSAVGLPNLATAYAENERSASSLIAVTDLQTGIGGIGG